MKILITGGTGSLGTELVRQLLQRPASEIDRIAIYSRDEQKQEVMRQLFNDHPALRFFIGDVRDERRLELALTGIDTVIHAAALKIVPKGEYDPSEFMKTNVNGTNNVIHACIRMGVRKAILASTDKAVNPVNLYGSSKLMAEKLFVAGNALSGSIGGRGCKFSVVRYGNVVNSRGSVVPFWRILAAKGEKLPITHPDMTRFWITLDQAADLVLSMIPVMKGGEIFVPRLPAFSLTMLASAIGKPGLIIGIRPGEKIHEALISPDEARQTFLQGDLFIVHPPWDAPVKPAFAYSSDMAEKLSIEELRERLA